MSVRYLTLRMIKRYVSEIFDLEDYIEVYQ